MAIMDNTLMTKNNLRLCTILTWVGYILTHTFNNVNNHFHQCCFILSSRTSPNFTSQSMFKRLKRGYKHGNHGMQAFGLYKTTFTNRVMNNKAVFRYKIPSNTWGMYEAERLKRIVTTNWWNLHCLSKPITKVV